MGLGLGTVVTVRLEDVTAAAAPAGIFAVGLIEDAEVVDDAGDVGLVVPLPLPLT